MNLATLELELELHTYLERAFALAHNAQWSGSRLLDLRTSLLEESRKNGFSEFAADVLNRCDQVADQLSAARLEVQQGFGLSETNPLRLLTLNETHVRLNTEVNALLELVHAPARLVRLAVDMYASSDDEKRLVASSKYETALRLEENGMEERLDSKSKAPVLAQVMAWTDLAERLERIEPENAFSGVHGLLLASDQDLRTLEAELSVPDTTDEN
jgi:hypothetical protein